MSNTTLETVLCDKVEHYRLYDALPPALRQVMAQAPFNYDIRPFYRRYQQGGSIPALRAAFIAHICKDLQDACLQTYGPDHPDAQRSRLKARTAA